MIAVVARKEFLEIARDGRLRWLAAACVLLMLVSALSGLQDTLAQMRDQAVAGKADRENFLAQGTKNPHAAAHFGQYAFRPVLLPAAIDPGASAYMGSMIWLEAHRQNLPEFRPAEDGAAFARTSRLSVAWVLQFVVPLFVIVLGFSAVAGERERGTLALALSQGLALRSLLLGKALAGVGALLVMLLPLALVALAVLLLAAPGVDTTGAGGRLAWMALGYTAYLLGFAGLSMLVSLLAASRRSAFFVLVTAWLLVTLVVPRIAADLAAGAHPTPTASEFWAAIRRAEGAEEVLAEDPAARTAIVRARLAEQLLAEYAVERVEDLPVNFTAVLLQRLEEYDASVFDHNYAQLWGTFERQRQFQQPFSILAPAIAMRALSMALAGADPFAQQHFSQAAEQHRRAFIAELNDLQAREGAGRAFYVAPADAWTGITAFHYRSPPATELLVRHRSDLMVLAAWAVLPLGFALWLAGRSRPLR